MSKGQVFRIKIYRAMIYVAAVVLVLLAIMFSIARVLLQDMGNYRDVVEQQVSQVLNQKVSIQGFDARLEGITPVLIFKDVALLHSEQATEIARFSEARIGLSVWASLRESQLIPGEISINGIHIVVTRHKSGSLSVQGLEVSQLETDKQVTSDSQLAQWLFNYSDLSLENSTILWRDDLRGQRYDFNNVNLQLKNNGLRHVLSGQLDVPKTLGREVKFSADIEGDSLNPKDWQGSFFLQAFSVNVKQWEQFQTQWKNTSLKDGQIDLRLWGAWKKNQLTNLSGDVSAYDLLLQEKKSAPINIKLIAGMFDWKIQDKDWQIKLKDFQLIHQNSIWPKTEVSLLYESGPENSYQLSADKLRLENIHSLMSVLGQGLEDLHIMLNGIKPAGDLKGLQARVFIKENQLNDFIVKTEFSNLHTTAWKQLPAIQGFQGTFSSTSNHGEAKVENRFSTLFFPKLFRGAFSLQQLNTSLVWKKEPSGWMLSSTDVQVQTPEIKANANMYLHIPLNKSSPYMDLQVQFWEGDASQASIYYPVGIMDEELVQWLDQGIVGGNVSFGGAIFTGRLHEFPFRQQQGNFMVQFYADNVELDYQAEWPHLTNARVDAGFTGDGMHINGLQAQLLKQTTSQQVEVTIQDFLNPELHVQAKTKGPTKEVFEFLVNSPIAPEAKTFVESVVMQGDSSLNLDLYVPLNKEIAALKPLHYRGDVELDKSQFLLLDKAVDIRKVNGSLQFSEAGLTAKGLKAEIMGEAATLDVYTQDFKEARPIQIVGQGKIKSSILASRFHIPGLNHLSGKTKWQGVFTLPYEQAGQKRPARLSLSSNLKKVGIRLPKPLNKTPDEVAAFLMDVEFPAQGLVKMSFQYKDVLRAVLGLGQQAGQTTIVKGGINFGNKLPPLPEQPQLKIQGSSSEVMLSEWINVFSSDIDAGQGEEYDWREMPLELAMERLHLIVSDDEDKQADSGKKILPQQWPLMNGYINHLVINDTDLGKFSMAAVRDRFGFNIKQLELTTPFSNVSASGHWQYRRQHETSLNIEMSSKDLGEQLSSWGFAAIIKGGKVEASHMQVSWKDNPFGFEFAKLEGVMNAHIEDGNITEVNPGAGRLFGLLSLSALPRRLFLDFADMKSGFAFDTVKGTFDIHNGNATTNNLYVDSTLAKVVVDGRTGLAQQDYDLNVLVIPNISGTAALPGYLVWGPQVGAVLLFFKQLFGSEIDKSAASGYHITGTWEEPVIEKVVAPEEEEPEQ